jgi:SRSO17 transposase
VFLGYATAKGRALIDRALYLPKEWAGDAGRRAEAKVPDGVRFATKLVLARRLIDRAVDAGVPAAWVTADSVYGSDYHFRAAVEARGLGYVVGVRSGGPVSVGGRRVPARSLPPEVPTAGWHRVSCGAGTKGPRAYDWAVLRTNCPDPRRYARWLLIRRSVTDPADVSYFACGGPPEATLEELVRIAGTRWAIEDLFELAKGDCGLDEYEVRSWVGWHRHVTLSLFALAVLAVVRSRAAKPAGKRGRRA